MAIAGIICEYNPFHLGHRKQFAMVREALGGDTVIVCLKSGSFVQRLSLIHISEPTRQF